MKTSNLSRIIIPATLVLAASIAAVAAFLLIRKAQSPTISQQQEARTTGAERSSDDVLRLVEAKNHAIGELENGDFGASIARLEKLAGELPDEPLVATNLTIAYLLCLKSSDLSGQRGGVVYQQILKKASLATQQLLRVAGESATSHVLASKIARLADDEGRSIEHLNKAVELAPVDPVVWYELYQAGRYSDNAATKDRAFEGLQRAYELRPDNLFVLKEWVLRQAMARDPAITETLAKARPTIKPFADRIRQLRKVDLLELVDKLGETVQDDSLDDQTKWNAAIRTARLFGNVLASENATRVDFRRIDRRDERYLRELEFVIHDFSEAFYAKRPSVRGKPAPPIPVRLVPSPVEQQLPPVPDVRFVELADFDLDGRLDVVAVRGKTVEVYGRRDEGAAWQPLADFQSPGKLHGVVVADLDRDCSSGMASRAKGKFRNSDCDLIVFGPGGLCVLRNTFDETTEDRSLVAVPQNAAFEQLCNVLAVSFVDLDHEGDLDLVVSTDAGISLWSHGDNMTFEDISHRSDLPSDELRATAILPVDWDRNADVDVLLASPSSDTAGYLENLRHGRFRWQPFSTDYGKCGSAVSLCLADVDGNASWDLIVCGENGIKLTQTTASSFGLVRFLKSSDVDDEAVSGMITWDYDNDGYLDIVAWGDAGLDIWRGGPDGQFQQATEIIDRPPARVEACAAGDVDGDGDWDLLVADRERLVWYMNEGGNRNHWIDVVLRADPNPVQFPHLRIDMHGIGSRVELKAGAFCQSQLVTRSITHFGLGELPRVDVVRVLWTNGIVCNEIDPKAKQLVHRQQELKGM